MRHIFKSPAYSCKQKKYQASQKKCKEQKTSQSGFTLVELAISMIIIGLLTAGLFAAFKVENQKRTIRKQIDNFEESRKMLRAFAYEPQLGYYGSAGFNGDPNGGLNLPGDPSPEQIDDATAERLPCPADPTLGVGDANFGREALKGGVTRVTIDGDTGPPFGDDNDPETGANNMTEAENGDGRTCDVTNLIQLPGPDGANDTADDILIGAFPFRSLGMTVFEGTDAYRQQYTYAVTAGATLYGQATTTSGSIQINDIAGQDTGNRSQFILVSHGETGRGARSIYGALIEACGGGIDSENCNGDEVFIAEGFSARRGGAQFYDDLATNTFQAVTSTDTWWEVHDDGTMIYNTNDGMDRRVIMGNAGTSGDPATDAQDSQVSIENILNPAGTDSAHLSFFGEGADDQEHFGYITLDNPDDPNEQLGIFMALNSTTGDVGPDGEWTGTNEDAFMVLRSRNTAPLDTPGMTNFNHDRFIFWADGQSFLNGNMGIRERLPETSLHITQEPGNDQDGITLENLAGTQSRIVHWDAATDQLQFRVGDVASDTDTDMSIAANGDVGIGTESNDPADRLEVSDTLPNRGIRITNADTPTLEFDESGTTAQINFTDPGGGGVLTLLNDRVNIQRTGTTGTLNFNDGTVDTAFIRENSGDLTIQANGNEIYVTGDTSVPGGVFMDVDGDVEADAFLTSSDARLKTVLGPSPGVNILKQISVYKYKWKDNAPRKADDALHSGVLAQELRDIPELSHLVHGKQGEVSKGEYLRVDYVGLVPLLIQSAKEISAENTSLEQEITAFETRQKDQIHTINVLESDIKALKDYVRPAPAKGAAGSLLSPWQQILLTLTLLISGAGLGVFLRKRISS